MTDINKSIRRWYSLFWGYVYKTQYSLLDFTVHPVGGLRIVLLLLLLFFALDLYFFPAVQEALQVYFSTDKRIAGLRSLILNLGITLVGATAIVSSLVMFAMQVNIERMPYGLFRRLSADSKLLGTFAVAFLVAVSVATLSVVVEKSQLSVVVLAAGWGIIFILALFLYAYRRALVLINPLQQLGIVIEDARKELLMWDRRAKRLAPLLEPKETPNTISSPSDSTHDLARTNYFLLNPYWTYGAKRAIKHAMSFARRYAEQGDYEISNAALNVVVGINTAYIEAKGKTFYAHPPFGENRLASDGFITDTLEHLRQNLQAGIVQCDEQQIEQTMQAMAALVQVYLGIDYSSPIASKSHANIATGYLSSAVESVVPHNMADVLMEGVRLMGQSAQRVLAQCEPREITTLSEKIAMIACTGCAKKDYHPVTMEGMTQLANLTFELLRSGKHNIHQAAGMLRHNVVFVSKLFLKVPDTPLSSTHSSFLGPYYSSTSGQSLRTRMVELVNALVEAKEDNTDAQSVIRNIEQWADGMYETEKELLLAAVEAKSPFVFDMIHWITGVTEILLALSNATACNDHCKEKLQSHARWLISTLTWIPDDKDTVTLIENYNMTETLFEAAMNARNRDCEEISTAINDIFLSWTFRGGKYQTGWGILERGLCGLAVFALTKGDVQVAKLKSVILEKLAEESKMEQYIRDNAARGIKDRAAELYKHDHFTMSHIDREISQADHQKLRPLLEEIANILSPGIALEVAYPRNTG